MSANRPLAKDGARPQGPILRRLRRRARPPRRPARRDRRRSIAPPRPKSCRRSSPPPNCRRAIAEQAQALARRLVTALRERPAAGLVQGLMREYALSSQEGVALMCMAEALLRIPDAATRDALIADKIGGGEWRAHVGQSPSPFVNAATWGLLITGQLVGAVDETGLARDADPPHRALRRADHPRQRRHGDAGDRRAIRLRPDDRARRSPTRGRSRRAATAIPTTCSARRRRPPRTPSAISRLTKRR